MAGRSSRGPHGTSQKFLWGSYTAPPADVTTVDIEVGGPGKVEPASITSGSGLTSRAVLAVVRNLHVEREHVLSVP